MNPPRPSHRESARGAGSILSRRIGPAPLAAALLVILCLDQLLLWRFVDFAPAWLYALGAALAGAIGFGAARLAARIPGEGPAIGRIAACFGVALVLYLLGGEGRIFYANTDWQVRDAVLRDMVANPWPFAYAGRGFAELLRAPLGMYLLPALAGKAVSPAAADVALLLCNALMLALVLALGSMLFADARARRRGLIVFLLFCGLDVVGQLLIDAAQGTQFPDHIDSWADIRFSGHVIQAFWVPQHAMAGWIAALVFLLWRDARAPLGLLLAAVPLVGLWSPLAMMGALPFAGLAAAHALTERTLRASDIALPALATLLAAPGLLYLVAGGDSVGLRLMDMPPALWAAFELIEFGPYLVALYMLRASGRAARSTYWTVVACLLLMPWLQIGESIDFMMRATIPAIAILSMSVADALKWLGSDGGRERRGWTGVLVVCLFLGSFTAAYEVRRAVANRPPLPPRCTLEELLDLYYQGHSRATYMAPVAAMPAAIRPPAPTIVPRQDRSFCWGRPWETPR